MAPVRCYLARRTGPNHSRTMTDNSTQLELRAFANCSRCRRRSTWIACFKEVHSFGEAQFLCPNCADRKRIRGTYVTWLCAFALITMIPAAVWAGWLARPLWLPMIWAGIILAQYLALLPHELGHALMARAVGHRPLAIVCGGSRPIVDTKILGVRTLIGPAPEDGMAAYEPLDDRAPRLKSALIVAAGPVTNLFLALLCLVALAWIDEAVKRSILAFSLLVFGLANAWLGLANLWPSALSTAMGKAASDGAQLLSLWKDSLPGYQERRADALMIRSWFEFRDEQYARVLGTLDEVEAVKGNTPPIAVTRSAALCGLDRPHEASECLRRALASGEERISPDVLAMAQNNLAWASLMIDDPEDQAERLRLSSRAIEVLPWIFPVVFTRICVIAAASDPSPDEMDEVRMLMSRLDDLDMGKARRALPLMTGLLAAAQGDFETAHRRLTEYRATPDPGMVVRVLEARIPSR